MQFSPLRTQRVLVSLGFVGVGAGGLPLLGFPSISANDQALYWIVTALGYGVLAWACWAWLTALGERRGGASGMRRVLRLFAVSCVLLGIAYFGFVNELIHFYRQRHHVGVKANAVSDLLLILGFCLAASGFWSASNVVEAESTLTPIGSVDSAGIPTH